MLLSQFDKRFPNEKACEAYFRSIRESVGITCRTCACTDYKWLPNLKSFQCNVCGQRTPLTAGTVMEHSKLSLRDWFYTAHLMTSIKQVLSAKEVQHQLSLSYPSTWLMMMKLRDIMGKREDMYMLSGEVELDEAYFPTKIRDQDKDVPLKRGAGSQKQTKVLVIVESKSTAEILGDYMKDIVECVTEDKIKKFNAFEKKVKRQSVQKVVRYIKMFSLENLEAKTIDKFVSKAIDKDTIVVTDGSNSHVNFKDMFKIHKSYIEIDPKTVVKTKLPWVHIVIGECRSGIEAIHKEIDARFLQLYLNEYCWKFNRRFFRDSSNPKYDLFDRLIKIAALYTSDIKWDKTYSPDDEEEII